MLPLFLIVFIDLVGFGIMMPLLPYYAKAYGASAAEVSLLFAMYSIGQFVFSPIWGRLSDRYGRKPVLMVSLAGSVIGYVTLAKAGTLPELFAARLLSGVMAGNISTAMAYIADITTPDKRAKGMGMIGAAFGLGFILGPVIGAMFSGDDYTHADFSTPAFLAAALSATALLGVMLFVRESLPPEKRAADVVIARRGHLATLRAALRYNDLRRLIAMVFLITTAMALLETSFTIWINGKFGWGPRKVGFTFAFIGVIMAAIQGGGIGRLTRRFGEAPLLLAGAAMLTLALILLPLSPGIPVLLVAVTFAALGYGLSQPILNSLVSKESSSIGTGLVLGVSQSASSLARIAGPLLSGIGFGYAGLGGPFAIAALIMLPVLFLLIARAGAARTAEL